MVRLPAVQESCLRPPGHESNVVRHGELTRGAASVLRKYGLPDTCNGCVAAMLGTRAVEQSNGCRDGITKSMLEYSSDAVRVVEKSAWMLLLPSRLTVPVDVICEGPKT